MRRLLADLAEIGGDHFFNFGFEFGSSLPPLFDGSASDGNVVSEVISSGLGVTSDVEN